MIDTWQAAEEFAAEQMMGMGFADVALTGPGADRGIDVSADGAVGQVKHLGQPVGRPAVQQLIGTGGLDDQLLLFSLGGFTSGAVETADAYSVALFSYTVHGDLFAANETGRALREAGWLPPNGDSDIAEFAAVREAVGRYIVAVVARSATAWDSIVPLFEARIAEFEREFGDATDDEMAKRLSDPRLREIAAQHLKDRREFRWISQHLMPLLDAIRSRRLQLLITVPEAIIRFRRIENIVARIAASNRISFEDDDLRLGGLSVDGLTFDWQRQGK